MKVWRCTVHGSDAPHGKARCWYAIAKLNDWSGATPGRCALVKMQLVPLDARVVEGDGLHHRVYGVIDNYWGGSMDNDMIHELTATILAALAVSEQEGA